jgi:hypothetical protein
MCYIIYLYIYMSRRGSRGVYRTSKGIRRKGTRRKGTRRKGTRRKGIRKETRSIRARMEGAPSSPELSGGEGQVILQILVTEVKTKYCEGVITGVGALTGFTDTQAKEDYRDSLEDYNIFVGGVTRVNRVSKRKVEVGHTLSITVEFDQGDAMMDSL